MPKRGYSSDASPDRRAGGQLARCDPQPSHDPAHDCLVLGGVRKLARVCARHSGSYNQLYARI